MSNTSLNHIAEWCNVLHTHSHTHSFIHNTHTYSHTHTLTLRHTHLGTHTCTWTHTHTDTHSLCSSCHLYHISLTPVRLMSSACKDRGAQGHSAGGKRSCKLPGVTRYSFAPSWVSSTPVSMCFQSLSTALEY